MSAREEALVREALEKARAGIWGSYYGHGIAVEYARAVDDDIASALAVLSKPAAPEEKPALITDHEYLGCTLDRPDERCPRVPFQMASADLCHYEHDMGKPCAQPRTAHAPAQADREGR